MKALPLLSRGLVVALGLASTTALLAALAVGGTAYSKRFKTTLLTEPSPLAAPAGEVSFARKLNIKEVRGRWLRVADGSTKGWVFSGNVSDTKPEEVKGLDGLPVAASQTTATAAARPLTPAATDYANRRNLNEARADLDWLNTQCHAMTDAEVQHFLQEKKKGEFQ
jgi:hypothetical protein